jgi:ribonuclease HI
LISIVELVYKAEINLLKINIVYIMNELSLTLSQVLNKYHEGPQSGIFTDGGARPNPGPGGWGFVIVENSKIIYFDHGHIENTTNNRMELTAILMALEKAPKDIEQTIYSDSNLCVQTFTTWIKAWKLNNWQRKSGEIANLDLIKKVDEALKMHKKVTFKWVKAHNGWLWNEYADSLSSAWTREVV